MDNNLNCDSLFLEREQNGLNETWLQEDLGSIFILFNKNDFVIGIGIVFYIAGGLCVLQVLCACMLNAYQICRARKVSKIEALELVTYDASRYNAIWKYSMFPQKITSLICEYVSGYNKYSKPKSKPLYEDTAIGGCDNILPILCVHIFAATLLVISYIPTYIIYAHMYDSYNSYVEVECIAYDCHQNKIYDGDMFLYYNISRCDNCIYSTATSSLPGCFIWEFDMFPLCETPKIVNTSTFDVDYTFYGKFISPNDKDLNDQICYINKNNFKIRSGAVTGCACNTRYCCSRCGLCHEGCCLCWNCCGLLFCGLLATAILCAVFGVYSIGLVEMDVA